MFDCLETMLPGDRVQAIRRLLANKSLEAASRNIRCWACPSCQAENHCFLGTDADAKDQRCRSCGGRFCIECETPAHPDLTCEDNRQRNIHGVEASEALAAEFCNACPWCGAKYEHMFNDACHHVNGGRGCPECGKHWCTACGRPQDECDEAGTCQLFCHMDLADQETMDDRVRSMIEAGETPVGTCGCRIDPFDRSLVQMDDATWTLLRRFYHERADRCIVAARNATARS
jgi:hypothetical protein